MGQEKRISCLGLMGLLVGLMPVATSSGALPPQTGAGERTPATSPDSVLEQSLPSMALIFTGDETARPVPSACAFIRRPDGVLLTTYHAIKNARQLQVVLASGEVYDKAELIAFDERRDTAALRVAASRLPVTPAGTSEELKAGDPVYALYGSAAKAWVVVPGHFQTVRTSDGVSGTGHGYRLLEFTPSITSRLSGGVLLNAQGQALGLLISYPGAPNAGYAIPLESIAGLADASPGSPPGAVAGTAPAPPLVPQPAVRTKQLESAAESKMSSPGKLPLAKKTDPEDILRGFKSYYIKSDTIYMHPETLQKELQNRQEFLAWGLTPIEDSKVADVVITITLPFLTWEWSYRMVYQPTGAVLGTGKVSAAVEKTAAPQLAAMIVKRIRGARPLPASFQDTQGTPQALANSRPEKGESWKVRYISGPASGIAKDTPVTLSLNREWMTVRNSRTLVFSAPVLKLSAVDSRTEVHRAAKGWEDFWGASFDTLLRDDGNNSVASAAAKGTGVAFILMGTVPIALLGEGILAPMKTTDHFVNMYWFEDGAPKSAEFRASAGDAKSLLAELKKVTGRRAEDIQELAEKRRKLIAEQFDVSPVTDIDRQVSIGWHTLAPGQYHLIVLPRENNLAEVYFLPASKPAPDFSSESLNSEDVGAQAVAELERRKTPRESKPAPSVSYREQNGIVTFSQIDTDDLILRFTPIPLGIAK